MRAISRPWAAPTPDNRRIRRAGRRCATHSEAGASSSSQLLTARAHPGTLFMTSPASRSAPILSTASRTARVRAAP